MHKEFEQSFTEEYCIQQTATIITFASLPCLFGFPTAGNEVYT